MSSSTATARSLLQPSSTCVARVNTHTHTHTHTHTRTHTHTQTCIARVLSARRISCKILMFCSSVLAMGGRAGAWMRGAGGMNSGSAGRGSLAAAGAWRRCWSGGMRGAYGLNSGSAGRGSLAAAAARVLRSSSLVAHHAAWPSAPPMMSSTPMRALRAAVRLLPKGTRSKSGFSLW
jgi:hypothetical protein